MLLGKAEGLCFAIKKAGYGGNGVLQQVLLFEQPIGSLLKDERIGQAGLQGVFDGPSLESTAPYSFSSFAFSY